MTIIPLLPEPIQTVITKNKLSSKEVFFFYFSVQEYEV